MVRADLIKDLIDDLIEDLSKIESEIYRGSCRDLMKAYRDLAQILWRSHDDLTEDLIEDLIEDRIETFKTICEYLSNIFSMI